ncbi:MAG: methyltransferase domain-containing protein [Acidobacteria bacterium]|nr:methyltransferase domain-containing protein [Acidobacteriota bacterium]
MVEYMMSGQKWNATAYAENGRFVADLAQGVVDWLAPQSGERILDVGCGDGVLTQRIAQSGAQVTGVDSSTSMLEQARAPGLNVLQRDATQLDFSAQFDAAFSNAALHWIPREKQPLLLAGIRRAIIPGGRFVAEMGGLGNIAAIRVALQSVLATYGIDAEEDAASFYPSPVDYTPMLEAAGFRVERIELIPRPTPLKTGMDAWLRTFRNGVLQKLSESDRETALMRTVALLRPVLCDDADNWTGDYMRLRFIAIAV